MLNPKKRGALIAFPNRQLTINMKSNQVIQISGTPGQIVGIVPVQSNGTITVKLVGEMLQISSESFSA